jgi:hypothetical protein
MNIRDYLDHNSIKWFPINIHLDPKKVPKRIEKYEDGREWVDTWKPTDEEISEMKTHLDSCNAIAIDTSLIHQLDVDMVSLRANSLSRMSPWYESFCKKLPHIFYVSKTLPTLPIEPYKYIIGVEALTGRWAFSRKDAIVFGHEKKIVEM